MQTPQEDLQLIQQGHSDGDLRSATRTRRQLEVIRTGQGEGEEEEDEDEGDARSIGVLQES